MEGWPQAGVAILLLGRGGRRLGWLFPSYEGVPAGRGGYSPPVEGCPQAGVVVPLLWRGARRSGWLFSSYEGVAVGRGGYSPPIGCLR